MLQEYMDSTLEVETSFHCSSCLPNRPIRKSEQLHFTSLALSLRLHRSPKNYPTIQKSSKEKPIVELVP